MGRIEVAVNRGAPLQLYEAMWGPIYEAVLNILGSTGAILPIGDPKHGQPNATTFTTVGEIQAVFTWSEPPGSFDTPLDLTAPANFQGIVPFVTFNGTDEEADSPDAAYWSRDDSGSNPFSVGVWLYTTSSGSTKSILTKKTSTTGSTQREWEFNINTADKPALILWDESVVKVPQRPGATAVDGAWRFVVGTYDSTGGATAADGINIYRDGSVDNGTASNDASYVAMEDTTAKVRLGFQQGASAAQDFFNGKMAGGPLGPFFVQKELTADELLRLYELGRRTLAL